MEYEIDAIENKAGWFSGAHDKVAAEFAKLSKKRVDYINGGNWRNILGNRGAYIFRDYELYFAVSV